MQNTYKYIFCAVPLRGGASLEREKKKESAREGGTVHHLILDDAVLRYA